MLCKVTVSLKVSRILMHGDMDNAVKDSKDLVLGFYSLLKLEVFVPEWMGKEVKAYTGCASFKQPAPKMSAINRRPRRGEVARKKAEGSKHNMMRLNGSSSRNEGQQVPSE